MKLFISDSVVRISIERRFPWTTFVDRISVSETFLYKYLMF